MAVLNVDFTKRDYQSLLEEADILAKKWMPEWTARDDKDINWVALKVCCSMVALGNLYIDLAFNEQDPYSVQIYKNALRLAKSKGMLPRMAVGCRTTVKGYILGNDQDITIAKGTEFTGYNRMKYSLLQDVRYPAGIESQDLPLIYGRMRTGILGISDGSKYQVFPIQEERVQDKYVKIYSTVAGERVDWDATDSLLLCRDTDRKYKLMVNEDGYYEAFFGDSNTGIIPEAGSTLNYEVFTLPENYLIEQFGLAEANTITKSADTRLQTIEHLDVATGGAEADSAKEIGWRIPQYLSTSNRAVTNEDYAFLARQVAGVKDAKILSNTGFKSILVIPTNGEVASAGLRSAVKQYIQDRKVDQILFEVLNPVQILANARVTVYLKSGSKKADITAIVQTAIQDYLRKPNEIGATISIMGLYKAVAEAAPNDIKSATVTELYRNGSPVGVADIVLDGDEVSMPGTIYVNPVGGI